MHFAPERGLHAFIAERAKKYICYDKNPDKYRYADCRELDICDEVECIRSECFDIVIHNHVLEHLRCNFTVVLMQLHRLVARGGFHMFSVPIKSGFYREDLNPKLGANERRNVFGQEDHYRVFGRSDVASILGAVLPISLAPVGSVFDPETLDRINFPADQRNTINGSTVFCVQKK